MEETGASQLSRTDADAKLMKNKNSFAVAYNPQTMEGIRETVWPDIVEVVVDKGYEDIDNMVRCLENGIIPHVIPDEGKEGYEIELTYEAAEADITSTKAEELKKALHAGQIPKVYKDIIEGIKVKEVRRKVVDEKGTDRWNSFRDVGKGRGRIFCQRFREEPSILSGRRDSETEEKREYPLCQ